MEKGHVQNSGSTTAGWFVQNPNRGRLALTWAILGVLVICIACGQQNPLMPGPPPPPPAMLDIPPSSLPLGAVGLLYDQVVGAVGGTTPFQWSLASGSAPLPPGMSMMPDPSSSAQVELKGTPSMAGTFTFTLMVTDSGKPTQMASGSFTIMVQAAPNPVPTVTTLTPPSTPTGSATLPLGIVGSNFVPGATVNVGGTTELVPTQIFPNQLMVDIPAGALVNPGTFAVSVTNPGPGGGMSNTVNFMVTTPTQVGLITLVSENYRGTGGGSALSGFGSNPVSLTGRYVAFISSAPDLIPPPGPTQGRALYLRDTCIGVTGTCTPFTQLVGVNNAGQESNGLEGPNVSISEDGSVITFDSTASNLDSRVTKSGEWVYTRQLCGVGVGGCPTSTVLESLDSNNLPTLGVFSAMSREGEYIAFSSSNNMLWLHDSCIGASGCLQGSISVGLGNGGIMPNGGTNPEAVSVGGRFVYFITNSTNLGVTNGSTQIYLRNTVKNTTTLVSADNAGNPGSQDSYSASISDDGRYVAFVTNSALVPNDLNNTGDVYLRDTCAGISSCTPSTSLVTIGTTGNAASLGGFAGTWSMSSTGRYIAFTSPSSDLVSGVTNQNGYNLAYVRDTCLGAGSGCTPTTHFVSVDPSGNQLSAALLTISGDGHYFVFEYQDPISGVPQVAIGATGY